MAALDIEGAWIFTPRIHTDSRGSFSELFSHSEFEAETGRHFDVAQANCSVSRRGAIRGIHVSEVPPGQAKYVTCTSGAILDVVVDLRTSGPGYGRWAAIPLSADNRSAVFIEEGLGHALVALSDAATVVYLCSTPYAPEREHGVHPFDTELGIKWPAGLEPVLSDKDAAAPSLAEAQALGLLPDYGECVRYARALRGPSLGAAVLPPAVAPSALRTRKELQ
jgi:dTDP-4-dehydrorhamnose 3,5-epimerase